MTDHAPDCSCVNCFYDRPSKLHDISTHPAACLCVPCYVAKQKVEDEEWRKANLREPRPETMPGDIGLAVRRLSGTDVQALQSWLTHNEASIAKPGNFSDYGMLEGVFEAVIGRKAQ